MPTTPAKPRNTVQVRLENLAKAQGKEITRMTESMADLQLAIEDRGWTRGGNQYSTTGLDLPALRIISDDLRSWLVGGGMVKRICEIRGNSIYGDGVGFKNYAKAINAFTSPNNVVKLFSTAAMMEINRSHGTDGTVVFLINKTTKQISRYGIEEMGLPFVDSNDRETTWFVRRTFTRITMDDAVGTLVDEYYPTDLCPADKLNGSLIAQYDGNIVPINTNFTAVVWDVNKQVGWPLGIPDLLPSLQWAEKYTDYLKDQSKFAKALAQIAWQYRAQNTDQAKKIAAAITPDGIADSAIQTPGMDMKPLPGNSGVTFDNGAALAAQAAAAGEVTKEDLLAEGQYAPGARLDPNVRKMIGARRQAATEIFKRIGKLLGAPKLEVVWPNIDDEDPFRDAQMIVAAFQTGAFSPSEIRPALAHRTGIELAEGSTVPKGVITPNNQKAIDDATAAAVAAAKKVSDNAQVAADQKAAGMPMPTAADTASKPGTSAGLQNQQGKDSLGVGKVSLGDNTTRDKNGAGH
ncbi:hypothetical protein [Frigoribacterium sp. UYMn621]|uniref:hypothetical protein n=1 Tax=Frigoribacterium sp. UYMn621 TaxID=3156343 RepID=UPI00339651EF